MDGINAMFELMGAAMLLPSVFRAIRLKTVQGVHIATPLFFWLWGLWNVIYYPSLAQWQSTLAGLLLLTVNTVWLWLVWRYTPKDRPA